MCSYETTYFIPTGMFHLINIDIININMPPNFQIFPTFKL